MTARLPMQCWKRLSMLNEAVIDEAAIVGRDDLG